MSEKVGILKFLGDIWGPENANVYLATKPEQNLFSVSPLISNWRDKQDIIVEFIIEKDAKMDVYYSMAHYRDGSESKEKVNAVGARVLWIELEGDNEGQARPKDALEKLISDGIIPRPTYRIQSSSENAQHWYWILDGLYATDIIETLNRRIAYYLDADRACWNIDRVLRPPFTHNHKRKRAYSDGSAPAVDIIEYTGTIYRPVEFKDLPGVRVQLTEIAAFGEIPDIDTVFRRYPWDNKHSDLFSADKKQFWNEQTKDYTGRGNAMARLSYFCAEVGMTDEAMYCVLDDADKRWEKFSGRHDRERRIVEFIYKAREKYPSPIFVVEQQSEEPIQRLYRFGDFLKTEVNFEWLIQDLIAKQTINFLTAVPGVGKSRLAIQLGASLATGQDFLSWKMLGTRRVVFFSLEMGHPMLKHFASNLDKEGAYDPELLQENFWLVPTGEPMPFSSQETLTFFKYIMDEVKPEVVIINAMSSLSYSELKEDTAKNINNQLKAMLNEYKCTFYIIHHNRKPNVLDGNKPPTLADFYGSTYGATDAASVLGLWKPQGADHYELHTLKSRTGGSDKPVKLASSHDKFTFSLVLPGEEEEMEIYNDTTANSHPPIEFGFGTMG